LREQRFRPWQGHESGLAVERRYLLVLKHCRESEYTTYVMRADLVEELSFGVLSDNGHNSSLPQQPLQALTSSLSRTKSKAEEELFVSK
jgi:hypothetical protein